ncbi:DNA translocase FtsK [Microvirga sp. M2]|uniref:DNA translocase FtsK n=1 Tax=Microvirga sp. M2 TaxID=3073270 RepID=UPI0039C13090
MRTEIHERADSTQTGHDRTVWEAPWSSTGETEPGWWKAFALDKDVRATRTPDRYIKKQPETNVVALPASEAMNAVRLARAADRSCEEAIRTRLERLRAAMETKSTIFSPSPSKAEPSIVAGQAAAMPEREKADAPASSPETAEVPTHEATSEASDVEIVAENPDLGSAPLDAMTEELSADRLEAEAPTPDHAIGLELRLPVPVDTSRPGFSAFAFQSGLYRTTISFKLGSVADLSVEDAVAEDSFADEDEEASARFEELPEQDLPEQDISEENISEDVSEWSELEETPVPEAAEPAAEPSVDAFDPGYLALYGDEVAPAATPRPVLEETMETGADAGHGAAEVAAPPASAPVARVIEFPAPERVRSAGYELPDVTLLAEPPETEGDVLTEDILEQRAGRVEKVIRDFGVKGEVIHVRPGPVVTLYELEPAPGVKSSRVIALSEDIARSMSAVSARVAVIPGRNAIGVELPNEARETVYLREILESEAFTGSTQKMPLCLGKTIGGEPVIADLARMPHLLVAGTTGSGKSVAINTMILSLLYRFTPEQCRLIMVDPKMLELSVYDGIPHLLTPVVTDPKKAIIALRWAVREMEDRYKKMARLGVRNIDGFNARVNEAREKGEVITRTVQTGFDKDTGELMYTEEVMDLTSLPYIVVIVDEMADLMMVAGKEIEGAIQRLAQMARAAGIHVILATQRPSVDVITGTIKANFPTRISFQVTSKIDSRTILGEMGAEQLLGQGDMLYMAGGGRITRVHGPFCSDEEVEKVVNHLKRQGEPVYLDAVTADDEETEDLDAPELPAEDDDVGLGASDIYEQAVGIVLRHKKASTSYIQRRLQIGYNRAASLMERMEQEGIVGPANHAGKREILRGMGED